MLLALTLTLAADTCPAGHSINPDTLEDCCWDGRAWNNQACEVLPSACPEGQVAYGTDCCWPGQTWSARSGTCAGTPSCPSGYVPLGDVGCTSSDAPPPELGALSKEVIDAMVRSHMSSIKDCYQRELDEHPHLEGKLVVRFVIEKDGSVSSATTKATELNNANVEACVNAVFMTMKFPEPRGGGIVIVSYPFQFETERWLLWRR